MVAQVYVTEHYDVTSGAQLAQMPALTEYTLLIATTVNTSPGFTVDTHIVRLVADIDCQIDIGVSPSLSSTSLLLKAALPECFKVTPGHRLGVIARA